MAFIIPKKTNNTPVISLTASQAPEPANLRTISLNINHAANYGSQTQPSQVAPAPQEKEITKAVSQLDMLIQVNLEALTKKLEAAIPDIRTEMITIHKALAKDPAQVTILSPEECATIFAGYSKLSGMELVAKAAAKKGSSKQLSLESFE